MIERTDWNSPYVDKSRWIFDHLETLNLEPSEILVVLVINFLNEANLPISPETLSEKTHLEEEKIDECISSLNARGFLNIDQKGKRLVFSLEGLLDGQRQTLSDPLSQSLIHEFSLEFGRPLSGTEMEQILDLASTYTEDTILHALDEAALYDKRSVAYVTSVLAAWKQRGLSDEDIEEGKR